MNSEQVILLVDDSPESKQAKQVLRDKRIPFQSIPASGYSIPSARYGEATYLGLPGVLLLANDLSASKR